MLKLQFEPLTAWPKPPTKTRKNGQFRVEYKVFLADLERELDAIGARNVVVGACFTREQIRLDNGAPRANAKPTMPGIVLYFASKHGDLSFACDTYTDWNNNLRAIGKHLECLRAVDRWGVSKSGEQYKGYLALPAPPPGAATETNAALLLRFSGRTGDPIDIKRIQEDKTFRQEIYRAAVKATHPDTGGNAANVIAVKNAYDALCQKA